MTLLNCQHCGEEIKEDSSFCSNCGSKLTIESSSEKETISQKINDKDEKSLKENSPSDLIPQSTIQTGEEKKSKFKLKLQFITPLISFLVVATILTFFYFTEQNKNTTVLELQRSAEEAALDGQYDEAIEKLIEASEIRPNYDVLAANLKEIERAKTYSSQIETIKSYYNNQDFDKADKQISNLKEQLEAENGPLYISLNESVVQTEDAITIGKVKQEIESLTTVDALGSRLSEIETIYYDDVEDVKNEILGKIVRITIEEATNQLSNNEFAEALNTVNKGLSYQSDDEELLQLKEQIEQEKLAFEEEKEQEDIHNRTAAVELVSLIAELDENGNVYFEGRLVSTATVPIYSLTVYYTLYDANGQYLMDSFVYVDPYTLEPGDEGSFSGVVEGINQDVTVEVYNVTWYFDE